MSTSSEAKEIQTVFTEGELAWLDFYSVIGTEAFLKRRLTGEAPRPDTDPVYYSRYALLKGKYGLAPALSARMKLELLVQESL